MYLKRILYVLPLAVLLGAGPAEEFPQAEITNGIVRAKIYLPDAKKGYYRGTRFDWSGNMPELEANGHTYFGQWFRRYDPTLHDAIMGPVEAFSPVGYDEAAVGENFLVIGVGMLAKPEEDRYFFANKYQIVDAGSWKVKKKSSQVEFRHVLKGDAYAYDYTKTVALTQGKAELVLSHTLKNTGKKTIESQVYNHNFFMLDNQPTGPDYVTTLTFEPSGDAGRTAARGRLEGKQILYNKPLERGEHLQFESLVGFSDVAKDYDITIENRKTGAAVRITSDRPLSKLAFWSPATTICPEPFIHVKVEPGETFTWTINYQFYSLKDADR